MVNPEMTRRQNESLDWRTVYPGASPASREIAEFIALWQSKKAGDGLPARRDYMAEELILGSCAVALIDVGTMPERFRFRLVSTAITMVLGRDSTGRYLDELYDADKYDLAVAGYRHCIEHKTPAVATGRMVHADKDYIPFEAVDLPLASDRVNVDMILKGVKFGPAPSGA